jgi:hypothetical protein
MEALRDKTLHNVAKTTRIQGRLRLIYRVFYFLLALITGALLFSVLDEPNRGTVASLASVHPTLPLFINQFLPLSFFLYIFMAYKMKPDSAQMAVASAPVIFLALAPLAQTISILLTCTPDIENGISCEHTAWSSIIMLSILALVLIFLVVVADLWQERDNAFVDTFLSFEQYFGQTNNAGKPDEA